MKAWKRIGLGAALEATAMMWAGCGADVSVTPQNGVAQKVANGKVLVTGVNMLISGAGEIDAKAHLWVDGEELETGSEWSSTGSPKLSSGDNYFTVSEQTLVADTSSALGVKVSTADALLWRNGSLVKLPCDDMQCYAQGVATSGADVYAAGSQAGASSLKAVYWKNGVEASLSNDGARSYVRGMAVDGADVYIAGDVMRRGVSTATLWKNGTPYSLVSEMSSVAGVTAGSGVAYVCGWMTSSGAICWQLSGSTVTAVQNGTLSQSFAKLRVVGGRKYLVGDQDSHARLWVDGYPMALEGANDSTSYAGDVAVDGSDVYVSGYVTNTATGHMQAALWKNGVLKLLSFGAQNVQATGVAVR